MKKIIFILEVVWLDFIAKYLWKCIYPFVSMKLSKRCSKCILPENYETLDEKLICKACEVELSDTKEEKISGSNIDSILKDYQQKGERWDAVLLFSGGKDSTYMLNKITAEYTDLRILVMLVDNGFMSPIATSNAQKVLSKFNIDSMVFRPDKEFVKKTFNFAFKNIKKQGVYSLVDLVDGQITFDSARIFASNNNIPLVICGLSKNQVINVFGNIGNEFSHEHEVHPFEKYLGVNLEDVFTKNELKYWYSRVTGDKTRFILPMVEWEPSELEIVEQLNKLDLICKKWSGPLLTNNFLIPVIGIAEINLIGYSTFEIEFAKTIRDGKAPRRYWLNIFQMLELSAKTGMFLNKRVIRVIEELGLSFEDIGIKKKR